MLKENRRSATKGQTEDFSVNGLELRKGLIKGEDFRWTAIIES